MLSALLRPGNRCVLDLMQVIVDRCGRCSYGDSLDSPEVMFRTRWMLAYPLRIRPRMGERRIIFSFSSCCSPDVRRQNKTRFRLNRRHLQAIRSIFPAGLHTQSRRLIIRYAFSSWSTSRIVCQKQTLERGDGGKWRTPLFEKRSSGFSTKALS